MRIPLLVLVCSLAHADGSLPAPQTQSLPWTDRCAERLEAKRKEWARRDPDFANAAVRIEKHNGGQDAVTFHMWTGLYDTRRSAFWIDVYDQPVHPRPDREMAGADGWQNWPPRPLGYPILVRHLHPRSARIQPEYWVTHERWQAFLDGWQPLVDACLRD
jgi:hypothetical protein